MNLAFENYQQQEPEIVRDMQAEVSRISELLDKEGSLAQIAVYGAKEQMEAKHPDYTFTVRRESLPFARMDGQGHTSYQLGVYVGEDAWLLWEF